MENDQEKSHQPTQKKLDDARAKGEFVKSQEFNITSLYLTCAIFLFGFSVETIQQTAVIFSEIWKEMIPQESYRPASISTETTRAAIHKVVSSFIGFFAFLPIAVIGANIAQRSFVFVGNNVNFKLSRISPISGFKNKFGSTGLFEFLKNSMKAALFSVTIYVTLRYDLDQFLVVVSVENHIGFNVTFNAMKDLIIPVVAISICILLLDYTWQRHKFILKNMMSLQEIKDESRESEGDPHFKGIRRQKAIEISSKHMLTAVPDADVVIVNPTHYAVALQWNVSESSAPIIVALGLDSIALRIREIAIDNNVPIFVDIPTARALTTTQDVGDEIHPQHYAAVAVAIRFANKPKGALD